MSIFLFIEGDGKKYDVGKAARAALITINASDRFFGKPGLINFSAMAARFGHMGIQEPE